MRGRKGSPFLKNTLRESLCNRIFSHTYGDILIMRHLMSYTQISVENFEQEQQVRIQFLQRKVMGNFQVVCCANFLLLLFGYCSPKILGLPELHQEPQADSSSDKACPSRRAFPFFKDPVPFPQDVEDHPFLRLVVTRNMSSDSKDLGLQRIFIWPNTGNCSRNGQLTNGVMRRKATFLVETERYKEGLCMTVTPEVDPDGNRNVWTLPDSALQLDNLEAYDLVLEGNDDDDDDYDEMMMCIERQWHY